VLVGAGVAWPVFFLPQAYLAFPLFGFVVVVLGYFGAVVAMSKREGVLALFGERAGLAPRTLAAAALPRVIDTSVAIDGRVLDVVRAGFLHGCFLVPTPVLAELQGLADAGDDLRRSRGRRGPRGARGAQARGRRRVEVLDLDVPGVHEVDAKLVRICLDRGCALLTLDTNLAKAAQLAGVRCSTCTRSRSRCARPVAAGDDVPVLLLKAGKEAGQAVGYLDDGLDGGRRGRSPAARAGGRRARHQRADHRQRPAGLRPPADATPSAAVAPAARARVRAAVAVGDAAPAPPP
jgi:uncharacterized protein YacL